MSGDLMKATTVAVVITDTFNKNFAPVCSDIAPCLMPLVNRPLLDYTLESLSFAGIQEVILFCSTFADQIKQHVKNKSWPGLSISTVISEGCYSLGNAMRDLDAKGIIKSDFLLFTGAAVSNVKFQKILNKHKYIQSVDKGAVMTLILKEAGKRRKTNAENVILAIDSKTGRVLCQDKSTTKRFNIPLEIVLQYPSIDIRNDLLDTNICVCSAAVPPLFSDNFDFQTLDDFVRGLLINEEILASSVYSHVLLGDEYTACVNSWSSYQQVSADVINRWVHPQVPDNNVQAPYTYRRNNIYLQQNISLSKDCKLLQDTIIGAGSQIGNNTVIKNSVIGCQCKIGSNVTIKNSFLFDGCIVKDNCTISYAVLGSVSQVGESSSVLDGCILGPHVVLDSKTCVKSMLLQASESKDKVGSQAYIYENKDADDSDSDYEEDSPNEEYLGLCLSDDDNEEKDGVAGSESDTSLSDDEDHHAQTPLPDDTNLFYSEVVDSLVRGFEDKLLCDNLILEINSSRYAYNVSVGEVNFHVVRALLTLPENEDLEKLENVQKLGKYLQQLKSRLIYFLPILKNYVRNEDAQADCLQAIEEVASSNELFGKVAVKVFVFLYEKDILAEEEIMKWYHNLSDESESLKKQLMPFIKWMQEAEEESDSDSE
ncbi:unnamed protein product [Bemisia tabaci]|uniref:Translation initiation factor eIF2B subunit epsilon n=1 Tax=Bemisia tabaci TaxID=7038 RepID=A0A9P0F7I2_BEMTA|nr:unnamed protein product [Bemisia tabaci]